MVPVLIAVRVLSNKRFSRPSLILTVFFLCLLYFCPSLRAEEESCATLLQAKCLSCHYETRICQKLQKRKGKGSWKRTIKNMVEHGAKLNSEEQKKLVQCLAGRDSTILSLCNVVGVVKSLDTDGGKDITPYICVIRKQRF